MKLTLTIFVGEKYPKYYGLVERRYFNDTALVAIMPLHLVLRFGLYLYWSMRAPSPSFWERAIIRKYQDLALLKSNIHDPKSEIRKQCRDLEHAWMREKLIKKQKELQHVSPNDPRRRGLNL